MSHRPGRFTRDGWRRPTGSHVLRLLRELLALRRDVVSVREAIARVQNEQAAQRALLEAIQAGRAEDHELLLRVLGDPEGEQLPLIIGPVTEQRLPEV